MEKRTTAEGWDIYIDAHKEIVLVSLNGDEISDNALKQYVDSFQRLSDYKMVIVQNINSVRYADIEKLLNGEDEQSG